MALHSYPILNAHVDEKCENITYKVNKRLYTVQERLSCYMTRAVLHYFEWIFDKNVLSLYCKSYVFAPLPLPTVTLYSINLIAFSLCRR